MSVCIPTYNRASFLDEAIASIAYQATDDTEIVVSDNASTDNTKDIVTRWQKKFPRLRYFRWQNNRGFDQNILNTVELASGEYCWFLGSDDALTDGSLVEVKRQLGLSDLVLLDRINMSFDMKAVKGAQKMLNARPGTIFHCMKREDLTNYFRAAIHLGSLFSYMSSMIVRRKAWLSVPLRSQCIGSGWIHAVKAFDIMRNKGSLLYSGLPLVLNRTDNDSLFATVGYAKRRLVDLDYHRLASICFGDDKEVIQLVDEILASSYFTWKVLLSDKRSIIISGNTEDILNIQNAYRICFSTRKDYQIKKTVFQLAGLRLLNTIRTFFGK